MLVLFVKVDEVLADTVAAKAVSILESMHDASYVVVILED